ncbi:MAG: ABC transporter permease [Mycetocola sp.]
MNSIFAKNRWWLARLAALPLHLFVFAIVVFFIVRLVPGDAAITMTEGQASAEQLEAIRDQLGLNEPLIVQLGVFLLNLLRLDFGISTTSGQSVFSDVISRVPQTLELTLMALFVAAVIATLLSAAAVFTPRSPIAAIARGYSRAAGALPDFCLGIIAILIFYVVLRVAPAPLGRLDARMTSAPSITNFPMLDTLLSGDGALITSAVAHLVLPITAMSIAYAPYLMKQLIPGLEEQVDAPATRFRIASGGSSFMMVISVFRRALPAVLVVSGSLLGSLIGGAVVMESMFGLGGIGQYAVNAVSTSDYQAMQGVLIVIVAVVLLIFLVVDLLTLILDPRRRVGAASA